MTPAPRPRTTARKLLLWLHLWAGLALAVYAVVIGVTGSLLSFRAEFEAQQHPELHTRRAMPDGQGFTVDADRAVEAIRGALPQAPISLTYPSEDTPYFMGYVPVPGGARHVFVDPETGRVAGIVDPREGWVGTLAALHTNLSMGRVGRQLNGWAAIGLVVLCLTGTVLWWPANGRWRARFRLDAKGWAGFSRQLHYVNGAVGLVFVIVLSVTGTYFTWFGPWIQFASRFGRTTEPVPQASAPGAAILPPSTLERAARGQLPGQEIHRLQLVADSAYGVRVTFRAGTPEQFHLVDTVFLHPVTGAVIGKNLLATRPPGDSLLSWLSGLHFGVFGGIWAHVLWALLGLTLPVLGVTGCLIWWRRVVMPLFRREERERDTEYAPVAAP